MKRTVKRTKGDGVQRARLSTLQRVNNLEAAFVVHERRLKALMSRVTKAESRLNRDDGKSCIGFVHEEYEG